jgi:hypothetical protein
MSKSQVDLVEDLKHAHAHSFSRLCEIAHEAHAEITRLQRQIDGMRRTSATHKVSMLFPSGNTQDTDFIGSRTECLDEVCRLQGQANPDIVYFVRSMRTTFLSRLIRRR